MKHIITIAFLAFSCCIYSQNFEGKGDQKLQIGANFQDNVIGVRVSYDYGLGQNISVGVVGGYALGLNNDLDADFGERLDIKARFNANIGSVLNIDENFDVYPGINLSLKNFGGHIGFRYFFSDGFGLFTELDTPIAKYDTGDLSPAEDIYNQFTVSFGAVFNL
ncbi:DUF6646 family protein [Mesohalobacter halotolerans]|uniref:Outer membrane protein beta-barrel domain-containing protein n=1 Tax=Mesohalobacter halotolerans TaxID=1883405 RepID=A0A4U5TNW3_9FLAO|nr:DUF6646 family protein [Mesohalobacter halotolerans]TKS55573.1 hypothetical protein FCN74_11530 [Mesohalobacter halotolerans]